MRSILVPIDNGPHLEDRLQTALALARVTNGHVTVQLSSLLADMAVWEPFGGAALTSEVFDQLRRNGDALAAKVTAQLAGEDVPSDVVQSPFAPIPSAYAAARFADVIVTSLNDPLIEDLVLGARTPVLAVPAGKPMLAFDTPAAIAWDGGHEGALALRAALPLLQRASAVHLLTVERDGDPFPALDAASYLSRHDIHAEVHGLVRDGSIAATLGSEAHRLAAGLLVMGLFGRSRLREMLLGGVSRTFLDGADLPLLLAH